MIIFINDIPVRILKAHEQPDQGKVNLVLDAAEGPLIQAKLIHHVWIQNVTNDDLGTLLNFLDSKIPTNLLSLYLTVKDYDNIKDFLRQKFKVVKAAGGLVRKKEKFLMIYRMKKWDLPKGKIEKGEKNRKAAAREVEEECNVTVKVDGKICTTWHTYTMNKRAMIKKTKWYAMDIVDDSKMRPDSSEDIEETRWMNGKEVYHALEHSYKSIAYVFEQYYEMTAIKPAK
jgi:ADP-ribose pyrophosphatase YjhB (NUDIX family)